MACSDAIHACIRCSKSGNQGTICKECQPSLEGKQYQQQNHKCVECGEKTYLNGEDECVSCGEAVDKCTTCKVGDAGAT